MLSSLLPRTGNTTDSTQACLVPHFASPASLLMPLCQRLFFTLDLTGHHFERSHFQLGVTPEMGPPLLH